VISGAKRLLKPVIRFLVEKPLTWKLIRAFVKVANRFKFEKELIGIEKEQRLQKQREQRVKSLFSDLTVRNGFFRGLKYPSAESHGSSLYPKLLGSYESELTNVIEKICSTPYSDIVVVGCAEGFYATGLAMRLPDAKIHAYDINPAAIEASMKMASLNKVSGRIGFGAFCSPDTLKNFSFSGRSLIVCDCEGYEIELFNSSNADKLKATDILIELHDGKNERISPYLFRLFEPTHQRLIIQSVNCFTKAPEYTELKGLNDDELEMCLRERNGIMQWVFFTSRANDR
jgi:hypothetical protein